jgi:cell fate regulator YaaT (PSP1 superfamily)
MEMVREQALEGKGSSKLSGACGKLLCCLKYEVDAYKELRKSLPGIGSEVTLKNKQKDFDKKNARVIGLDILNQKVKLLFGPNEYSVVSLEDISPGSKTSPNRIKTT